MDTLSHGLWGSLAVKILPRARNNKKLIILAGIIGMLPDLLSFAPIFSVYLYQIITGRTELTLGPPVNLEQTYLFEYAVNSYNYTHSLVIFALILLLTSLVWRKWVIVLLPWGVHIVFDIFTHTAEFFPTPFLFPLSDFKISAFAWANPVFLVINYSLIILGFWLLRKKSFQKQQQIHDPNTQNKTDQM